MYYAVFNKNNGSYFAGFDQDDSPIWGDRNSATPFPWEFAKAQALLLSRHDSAVQKKPVAM